MEEKKTYSIFDVREPDPRLEKYRKDVLEKYLEFGLVALQKARDEGQTLDDVIDRTKTVLWYVKNERMQQIQNELGL
jgi:hypothetical protein